MRRITGLLLSLLSFAEVCEAQTSVSPAAIDRYVRAELARQRVPGLSVAILRGDSLLLVGSYGFANIEHHVRATDSTVYKMGSVTKQFTAAAVVMLSEQGRLHLDDSITQYVPEGSAAWRGITIRHLLTHTSGIPEYPDSLDWQRDYTEEEFVRLAATLPLQFDPGKSWAYSSTGYVLLGVIIHRVTGTFYGDFLREHIFRPLGMATARINSETDIVPNRAAGYHFVNDTLKNRDWVSPSINSTADLGLSLSVRDVIRWITGLDHGMVLSPADLEASWTPVRLNAGDSYPYGLGWHITQLRGYRRIGHSGSWQGFQTTIQRFPDFHVTVVVLANLAEAKSEAIAFGIAGLIEPRLRPPHLLAAPLSGGTPPETINQLLGKIVSGQDSGEVTAGLRSVTPPTRRERIGGWLKAIKSWSFLGCDAVRDQSISRLGARIEHICYAKGVATGFDFIFTVLYDPDWRAAGIDLYTF
jgi:CubicO group peptidase (beta-lactamase class C family)